MGMFKAQMMRNFKFLDIGARQRVPELTAKNAGGSTQVVYSFAIVIGLAPALPVTLLDSEK